MSKNAESYATTPSLRRYLLEAEFLEDGTVQQIRGLRGGKTPQRWETAKSLGTGSFGQVRQERRKDENGDWHYRAVKVCSRANLRRAQVDFTRELSALAAFSSSKYSGLFVSLMGWWMDSRNLYIATEYVARGDLSSHINETLLENDAKEIIEGALNGLQIMHLQGFTHRDIKPQNILVVQKPPEFQKWWVKIADFGISKKIHEDQSTVLHTALGTRQYCAPEILELLPSQETSEYSNKVDIWSLGCVMFNISSHGYHAFTVSELVKYCHGLIQFNPRERQLLLGKSGELLLRTFLDPTPEYRPGAADALKHEWFTSELDRPNEDINIPRISSAQGPSQITQQRNYNTFLQPTLTGEVVSELAPHRPSIWARVQRQARRPNLNKAQVAEEIQHPNPNGQSDIGVQDGKDIKQVGATSTIKDHNPALEAPLQLGKSTEERSGSALSQLPTRETPAGRVNNIFRRLWGTSTYQAKPFERDPVRTFEGHQWPIYAVAFSTDGNLVASASGDTTVKLWDINTGEVTTLKGHTGPVQGVAFSPSGQKLASGSMDATIMLWNGATKEAQLTIGLPIMKIVFSPDGRLLAAAAGDTAIILDTYTRERIGTIPGSSNSVLGLAFSPNGKQLLTGSKDRTWTLWDVATAEMLRVFEGHKGMVFTVVMSPDGRLAASASHEGRVIIWDAESGKPRHSIMGKGDYASEVDFSPDSRLVASTSWGNEVQLWDVATGKLRCTLKGHTGSIASIDFSPDGRLLVSGSHDKTVKLWEVPSKR